MTFIDDVRDDIATIINDTDEFGVSAVHTPRGGVPQPAFYCIFSESIKHGDDERDVVNDGFASITAIADDVALVKYRDVLTIKSVRYEVVNDAYLDSIFTNVAIVDLRRVSETKI